MGKNKQQEKKKVIQRPITHEQMEACMRADEDFGVTFKNCVGVYFFVKGKLTLYHMYCPMDGGTFETLKKYGPVNMYCDLKGTFERLYPTNPAESSGNLLPLFSSRYK